MAIVNPLENIYGYLRALSFAKIVVLLTSIRLTLEFRRLRASKVSHD
jgi:hypothetical protein